MLSSCPNYSFGNFYGLKSVAGYCEHLQQRLITVRIHRYHIGCASMSGRITCKWRSHKIIWEQVWPISGQHHHNSAIHQHRNHSFLAWDYGLCLLSMTTRMTRPRLKRRIWNVRLVRRLRTQAEEVDKQLGIRRGVRNLREDAQRKWPTVRTTSR